MPTAAEKHRIEEHRLNLARMSDPGGWPRWPVLPVKRRGHTTESFGIGIMVAVEGRLFHVYNASMFGLKPGPLSDQLDQMERKEYKDYEGILDDGWVVD